MDSEHIRFGSTSKIFQSFDLEVEPPDLDASKVLLSESAKTWIL